MIELGGSKERVPLHTWANSSADSLGGSCWLFHPLGLNYMEDIKPMSKDGLADQWTNSWAFRWLLENHNCDEFCLTQYELKFGKINVSHIYHVKWHWMPSLDELGVSPGVILTECNPPTHSGCEGPDGGLFLKLGWIMRPCGVGCKLLSPKPPWLFPLKYARHVGLIN